MKPFKLASLFLAGAVGLSACSDDATNPIASNVDAPAFNTLSAADASGKQMVVFKGNDVPSGFAAEVAVLGGTIEAAYAGIGVATVAGLDADAVSKLASRNDVSRVESDVVFQLDPPAGEPAATEAADFAIESTENPAAAPWFPAQWNMRAIGADKAWKAGYLGSSDVTVAILDTGIGYTHADLVGLVDLSRSKSFVPSDNAVVQQFFPGAHEVADLHYHGTHVAATVSSNGVRAAGVTSRTTLIGVKVLSRTGSGSGTGILAGIMYAADVGADVINMSLGGTFDRRDAQGYIGVINRAINYANRKGVVVVVSAGNSAIDLDHDGTGYKTYCSAPTTFCVSATGPTAGGTFTAGPFANVDTPASYTNFGRSAINVAAPGGNVTAVLAACSTFSLAIPVCQTSNRYVVGLAGTSMASPHVSGLAALMVQKYGHNNAGRVKTAIQQSADDLGPAGVDPYYGKGRINVFAAVTQ